jgi:replicative DNA helicase
MNQQPPSNIELEQIILGSLLRSPESAFAVPIMVSGDFAADAHRQIFSLIAAAAAEGRHLTPVSLAPAIRDLKFGPLPPHEYMLRMVRVGVAPEFIPGHIGELKQLSARRALLALGKTMGEFGQSPTGPLGEFLGDVVNELDTVAAGLRAQKQSTRHFAGPIEERIAKLRDGEVPESICTGLKDLDRIMGGWHRGELAVIAARTSMGKTAFVLSALRQAARKGTSSVFFSMEITADQASCRLLSDAIWNSQTPISYDRIDQHRIEKFDVERLERAAADIARLPLMVDDQRGLSVSEIGARARRVRDEMERKGRRLDAICIDHLGKIRASSRYAGNKVHETGEKTNALAQLALDLDVAVIVLQQLNRGTEGREEKRPGLSDLRDSGNIEEDADTVSFLYRPAYYLDRIKYDDQEKEDNRLSLLEKKRNVLELIVAKNRRGPICNKEFFISIESNAVRDLVA